MGTCRSRDKELYDNNTDGMSKFKLSATLKISLEEAAQLINDYFKAFPAIGGKLDQFGAFGVAKGYIVTAPPFRRIRFFDYWDKYKDNEYWMGKVERASKNTPKMYGSLYCEVQK